MIFKKMASGDLKAQYRHGFKCLHAQMTLNVKGQRHNHGTRFPIRLSVGALTKGEYIGRLDRLNQDTLCREAWLQPSSPPRGQRRRIKLWHLLFACGSCAGHSRTTLRCYCTLPSGLAGFLWAIQDQLNWSWTEMMCGFPSWLEAVNSLLCFESCEWIKKTLVGLLDYEALSLAYTITTTHMFLYWAPIQCVAK